MAVASPGLPLKRFAFSLDSFPPQNPKPSTQTLADGAPTWSHQPSSLLAASSLWDADVRKCLAKKKFKKVELDNRRAEVRAPCASHTTDKSLITSWITCFPLLSCSLGFLEYAYGPKWTTLVSLSSSCSTPCRPCRPPPLSLPL